MNTFSPLLLWCCCYLCVCVNAAFSVDSLKRKLENQVQRLVSDKALSKYHHAAKQASSTYKSCRFTVTPSLLDDLERLQKAVGVLRSDQQSFFLNEQRWTTWSVAHSHAVLFDRGRRLWSFGKGRAHMVNRQNFFKSAMLLAIAVASTIADRDERRREFILSFVAPPLVSAMRRADPDGRCLSGVIAAVNHYGSESESMIVDILVYAAVLMISYVFVKRIASI